MDHSFLDYLEVFGAILLYCLVYHWAISAGVIVVIFVLPGIHYYQKKFDQEKDSKKVVRFIFGFLLWWLWCLVRIPFWLLRLQGRAMGADENGGSAKLDAEREEKRQANKEYEKHRFDSRGYRVEEFTALHWIQKSAPFGSVEGATINAMALKQKSGNPVRVVETLNGKPVGTVASF